MRLINSRGVLPVAATLALAATAASAQTPKSTVDAGHTQAPPPEVALVSVTDAEGLGSAGSTDAAKVAPTPEPGGGKAATLSVEKASTGESVSAAPAGDEALTEVTVTGSRVIKNGNDSPTPMTVVGAEDLTHLAPTTIADALNIIPAFSGSKSQNSNPIGVGIFGGGNPAANSLNLRNLGLNDTLVLINGQRPVPTLLLGTVDVDMIPDMLIQRVDVVTGGVSAVYGSDALAGVVNYIYDKNFNGAKVEGQYTTSSRGDDTGYKAGIAGGRSFFDERLHIEGSVQRYVSEGILSVLDRPGIGDGGLAGNGSAANPYTLLSNLTNNNASFGGLISSGPLKGYQFVGTGVVAPFVHGTPTGTSTVEIGGDGTYGTGSLLAPENMTQAFGRADLNISRNVKGHLQVIFDKKEDFQINNGLNLNNYIFSTSNAFLPAALQQQLSAGGATTFTLGKTFLPNNFVPTEPVEDEEQTQIEAGVEGQIGKYNWNLNINYGRSALTNTEVNNINQQRLAASLDAVINPANGQVVCRATLTNPGTDPGCVPLNPFGPNAQNASAASYVTSDTPYTGVYHLYDANGAISGSLFSMWAGPVTGAISAEWRRLEFIASTSMSPDVLEDCTGILYNCSSGIGVWQQNVAANDTMRLDVSEAAVEFDVPLLKDQPLARAVNMNLAAREVSYSTVGSYHPYKIGPEWVITDSLRVRATYSSDISAPPLYLLFQPQNTTFTTTEDFLTGRTYTVPALNQGNPNLKAAVGYTKTLGLVWQPEGTGFSISTDYYHIMINNAITRVNVYQAQFQQACYSSGGTSPYCAQIIRPSFTDASASNVVQDWISNFQNVSSEETWGDDTEINYANTVFNHLFALRLMTSYQPHIIYTQPGNDTYDQGGVANGPTPLTASPSVRATFWGTLQFTDRVAGGFTERWRNAMKMTGNTTGIYAGNVFVPNHVAAIGYTDLNASYFAGQDRQFEFFMSVQNLFNAKPPLATLTINQIGPSLAYAASDDPIGLRFTVGVRASF